MAIVGSMDTWRNRLRGATDVELTTLDREMEQDNPLRPVLSDEVLRRSTEMGAAVAATPTMATTVPDAPNIPVTIPTAPQALATVPDAPARPGGRGDPPTDPVTLANRAQNAIEGGDQKTALEIYDFGLATHGQAFAETFNALKHEREVTRGGDKGAPVPTSVVSPTEGERLASGLRSTTPRQTPVPTQAAEQLPVVQPDPLVKVGTNAGVPSTPDGTGYQMTLNGLPRTEGGRGGALGYGGLPGRQAGRDDQETNPPGMRIVQAGPPSAYPDSRQAGRDDQETNPNPAARRAADLDRSLEDVSQHSIAPIAPGPVDRTVTSEALPPPGGAAPAPLNAGLRSAGRGPMTTGAGTAAGQRFLDGNGEPIVPGSDRPRRLKNGEYYDPPLGPQVMPDGTVQMPDGTVRPATPDELPTTPTTRALPRDQPMAAPPTSGGLATTVQTPAVDTGTNTPPSARPTASAAPPPDDGFMGKPDIWSFLTSAGLGAMASQSPNFLGAIGAGGEAGIKQLTQLRKDQRERNKNLADAQFQRERIDLGYAGENNQNQRTEKQIASNERINQANNAGQNQRQVVGIKAERDNLNTRLTHDADQAERNAQLNRMLYEHQERLKVEGKDLDRRGIYDFTIEKGGTPDEARDAALGWNPTKPDKPTPMSEKDVTLTHDMVANKLFGAGVPGSTLLAKLPAEISIEYQRAVGSKQDAASAYAAGMEVLNKYGITGKPERWWPGSEPELVVPKTPRPPTTAGGGGNYTYVPGQGITPK